MPIAYPYKFSDWYGYDQDCSGLTAFSCSTGTVFIGVCSQSINRTYYHDGSGTYPAAGNKVFSNAAGQNVLPAFYYKFDSTFVFKISGNNGVVDNSWPQDIC